METALCAECVIEAETYKNSGREELRARVKSDIFKALSDLPSYKQCTRVVIRETPFIKNTSNKIRRDGNGRPLAE